MTILEQVLSLPAVGGLSILEQLHAPCPYAPSQPTVFATNTITHEVVIFKLRCKSWSCPVCSQINKAAWVVRANVAFGNAEAKTGKKPSFLTLTSHEKLDPEATIRVLPHAWKKLSMRMRRAAPGTMYLIVPERHVDGRLHLHGIVTCDLGTRWWKDNARRSGMGYMSEEEEARSRGGVIWYVNKYITKNLETDGWAKGFRRVRTSVKFPKAPELPKMPGWEFAVQWQEGMAERLTIYLLEQGHKVYVGDHRSSWRVVNGEVIE